MRIPPRARRDQVADHGKTDHEPEAGHLEPDVGRNTGNDCKSNTVKQADHQLPRNNPPGNLAVRQ